MTDKIWYVPPKAKKLVSAYDPTPNDRSVEAAQPFTVSIKAVNMMEDLEGFLDKNNELLVTSTSHLGDKPAVQRIHCYKEGVKAGQTLKPFVSETVFVCDDYDGQARLLIEFLVTEVDVDTGEQTALVTSFGSLAAAVGAVFPVAAPYAGLAAGAAVIIDKLVKGLAENDTAIEGEPAFYGGETNGLQMPLRVGTYVLLNQEMDAEGWQLGGGYTLLRDDGKKAGISHIVFDIESGKRPAPEYVVGQKVATMLQGLKEKTSAGPTTLDFLKDTLEQYTNFNYLDRYVKLKGKPADELTDAEKKLMKDIEAIDVLKPFLPK